jgi:hypothetical protein
VLQSVVCVLGAVRHTPLFLSDYNETLPFLAISQNKNQILKFIASIGSRLVPCESTDGRTYGETDGRTDMTKLIVAPRNFANATKMASSVVR